MGRIPKPWKWEERGAWYATVNGVRHRLATTERAAKDALKELITKPPESTDEAIVVLDAFLSHVEATKSPATYKWHFDHIKSFTKVHGHTQVHKLKPHDIESWLHSHTQWKEGTKAGAFRSLRTGFNWAVKTKLINRSPMIGVEKPDEPNREIVLTKEEYQKVLDHCRDQNFKEVVQVAFECGPRPQEILRVTAKDVDLKLGAWIFTRINSKGKKHRRIVFLNDAALEVTKRRIKEFPEGPIYRNEDGEPWTPSSVSCRFARMKKWVGQKYCLYNLRHSFCHHALTNGVDAVTLSKLMGHVDSAMISRVYSHLLHNPDHMRDALKRVSQ